MLWSCLGKDAIRVIILFALQAFFFFHKKNGKKKSDKPHAHSHTHWQRPDVGVHGHHGAAKAQQKKFTFTF